MFSPTKSHSIFAGNKYTIKTGLFVPAGAVSLSFFYNKELSAAENITISDAPRGLIDHITAKKIKTIFNSLVKDDTLFPPSYMFIDEYGYEGSLNKINVNWTSTTTNTSENIIKYNEEYVTNKNNILSSIDYTANGKKGVLALTNIEFNIAASVYKDFYLLKGKSFSRKTLKVTTDKIKNSKIFPFSFPITKGLYNGYLPLCYIDWIPQYDDSNALNASSEEVKIYIKKEDIPNKITLSDSSKSYDVPLSNTEAITLSKKFIYGKMEDIQNSISVHIDDNLDIPLTKGDVQLVKISQVKYYGTNDTIPNCIQISNNIDGYENQDKIITNLFKNSDSVKEVYTEPTYITPPGMMPVAKFAWDSTTNKGYYANNPESNWVQSVIVNNFFNFPINRTYKAPDNTSIMVTYTFSNDSSSPTHNLRVPSSGSYAGILTEYDFSFNQYLSIDMSSPHTFSGHTYPDYDVADFGDHGGATVSTNNSGSAGYYYANQSETANFTDEEAPDFGIARTGHHTYYANYIRSMTSAELQPYVTLQPVMIDGFNYGYNSDGTKVNQDNIVKSLYTNQIADNYPNATFKDAGEGAMYDGDHLYNANGQQGTGDGYYNHYFRKVISFYTIHAYYLEGLYYGKYYEVTFEGNYAVVNYNGAYYKAHYNGIKPTLSPLKNYNAMGYYIGDLRKDYEKILSLKTPYAWLAKETYSGVAEHKTVLYNGTAYYEGIATKATAIGNLNPQNKSDVLLMYADADNKNYLTDCSTGQIDIESSLFYITNVFTNNVPLFYRYKLKYPIFNNDKNDFSNNSIELIDNQNIELDKNEYNYKFKFVDKGNNVYDIYIYTDFLINYNFDVYAIYNAYNESNKIIMSNYNEQINTHPITNINNYAITNIDSSRNVSNIAINNPYTIIDTRNKLNFRWKLTTLDGKYSSKLYTSYCINKNYAFPHEEQYFNNNSFDILAASSSTYKIAFDILKNDCMVQLIDENGNIVDAKLQELKNEIIKAILVPSDSVYGNDIDTVNNQYKLNLYTAPDGSGSVFCETTSPTGFLNTQDNTYTYMPTIPDKYYFKANKLYSIYGVKCRDAKEIKVVSPVQKNNLENWYPRIQYSSFTKEYSMNDYNRIVTYTVPEYLKQNFSTAYGKPYIDIKNETANVITNNVITVSRTPLYVFTDDQENPINLSAVKVLPDNSTIKLNIKMWYQDGTIVLNERINLNDIILVSYTYEELCYEYRGYYNEYGNYIALDLNPFKYHTYIDSSTQEFNRQPVYYLFNSTIYFFMKPSIKKDTNSSSTIDERILNSNCIYHKFNDYTPDDPEDIMIGKIFMQHNSSLKNTILVDTRVRGGGLKESISDEIRKMMEPESDYYFDIGVYDGEVYNENSIIVIKLDRRILKKYGGRFSENDVYNAVMKWCAFGTYPIIEYIKAYDYDELPQYNSFVHCTYNITDYVPQFILEKPNNTIHNIYFEISSGKEMDNTFLKIETTKINNIHLEIENKNIIKLEVEADNAMNNIHFEVENQSEIHLEVEAEKEISNVYFKTENQSQINNIYFEIENMEG